MPIIDWRHVTFGLEILEKRLNFSSCARSRSQVPDAKYRILTQALGNAGLIHHYRGSPEKAQECIRQALNIAEERQDTIARRFNWPISPIFTSIPRISILRSVMHRKRSMWPTNDIIPFFRTGGSFTRHSAVVQCEFKLREDPAAAKNEIRRAHQAASAASRFNVPLNNYNAFAIYGAAALRTLTLQKQNGSSDVPFRPLPRYLQSPRTGFTALDATGVAYAGFVAMGESSHGTDALKAFKAAREICRDPGSCSTFHDA
jgi:hypothetical protein